MKIKGIARYAHLVRPSSPIGSDKMKYSVQLLIHKNDTQYSEIQKIIDETFENKWPSKKPKNLHSCFKDLAIEESENPSLSDYMSLKCATSAEFDRPILVDENLKTIVDPSTQINGNIIWVEVNIGSYEHPLNSGVAAYLQGTLVTSEKGSLPLDAIIAKPSAETLFKDIINQSPSASSTKESSITPPPLVPKPSEQPQYIMTSKAEGRKREDFITVGWTDKMLIKEGFMLPPNGITPSFS